jgi:hypothetical protein
MWKSFGKLFLIFFGALFFGILAVITVRTMGLKQEYKEFVSIFRSNNSLTLVQVEKTPELLKNLIDSKNQSPHIFELKVKQISETQWGIESQYPELSKVPIIEFLQQHPKHFFYLNIYSTRSKALETFLSDLARQQNLDHLILGTPLLDTMKAIRLASTEWLTAHATSEIGRMHLFTNLYLEPIMDVPGDVFIMERPNERLRNELLRRKIFIF